MSKYDIDEVIDACKRALNDGRDALRATFGPWYMSTNFAPSDYAATSLVWLDVKHPKGLGRFMARDAVVRLNGIVDHETMQVQRWYIASAGNRHHSYDSGDFDTPQGAIVKYLDDLRDAAASIDEFLEEVGR